MTECFFKLFFGIFCFRSNYLSLFLRRRDKDASDLGINYHFFLLLSTCSVQGSYICKKYSKNMLQTLSKDLGYGFRSSNSMVKMEHETKKPGKNKEESNFFRSNIGSNKLKQLSQVASVISK